MSDIEDLEDILRDYADKEADSPKATEELEKRTSEDVLKEETTSKQPQQQTEWVKTDKEIQLEKLIFGDKEGFIENLKQASKPKRHSESQSEAKSKKRKPVWEDDDDETINLGHVKQETERTGPLDPLLKEKLYKEYLQKRFERSVAAPKWADLDQVEKADSDEEILRTVGFIDSTKSMSLEPRNLRYKTLKDINRASTADGPVCSINFHPTSTVAMVSTSNGIATLFAVNGRKNEKLHSMKFQSFPTTCAKILPCGTQALFGSTRQYYYSYDLMKAKEMRHVPPSFIKRMLSFDVSSCGKYFAASGRYDQFHLFDTKSKEVIKTFKQGDNVAEVMFTLDSSKVITTSTSNTVTIFDLKQQRQMHKFYDNGCIVGKTLALSPDGKMLATGSGEGVVNIYDYEKVFATDTPQPEKAIMNLTTEITSLKFNHTSEILAISSKVVNGAVKLVHFPTGTVFSNFPRPNTDLKKVQTIDFSPSSGYLAVGNGAREAHLFRLKHFNNY